MATSVLAIGLDAASAELIRHWAAAGVMSTFARLERDSVGYTLGNSLYTLPGAIWPEITTGISCGRRPHYYHARQLHTGEARPRPISVEDKQPQSYYWAVASSAGKRVAVLDQPQTVPVQPFNGLQLFEWGLHDRNFRIASAPPSLLDEINQRVGPHPVACCDCHGETEAGYAQLADDLVTGVRRKTELLLDVLDREPWDLFSCVYGESHCVGHQFWHFHESARDAADSARSTELSATIRRVYQEIDRGVGRLIEHAGEHATILVYTSHGMGPYIGGYQLLPEFLRRLGLGSDEGQAPTRSRLRAIQARLHHLPRGVQPLFRAASAWSWVTRIQARAGSMVAPLESPRTKAVALKNNRCGAIRINMIGREPNGRIAPGRECEALIAHIREELLALRHLEQDEAIVERVVTAEEAFGPDHAPDVPDLMVAFRTDLGPLEGCRSSSLGMIREPLYHPLTPRTGDHTPTSRLWIRMPIGACRGLRLPDEDVNVLDIAPTILDLLGVTVPPDMDGRSLLTTACIEARKRNDPQPNTTG